MQNMFCTPGGGAGGGGRGTEGGSADGGQAVFSGQATKLPPPLCSPFTPPPTTPIYHTFPYPPPIRAPHIFLMHVNFQQFFFCFSGVGF